MFILVGGVLGGFFNRYLIPKAIFADERMDLGDKSLGRKLLISDFQNLLPDLVRDLLISWADNQYSSGMLQEALTSGCLGPTGKLGNLVSM